MTQIGTVQALTHYPVKSMQGIDVDVTMIGPDGMTDDRRFAFVDLETGKITSPKLPHRWGKILHCRAQIEGGQPVIFLPDGQEVAGDDLDAKMSEYLGRQVKLINKSDAEIEIDSADPESLQQGKDPDVHSFTVAQGSPQGSLFDFAPLHLIASSTLDHIASLAGEEFAQIGRFRPNMVIDLPDGEAFQENRWTGQQLAVGDTLRLNIIVPTPRCAIPTLEQPGISANKFVTRKIGELNKIPIPELGDMPCLGAYASIVQPGDVRVGDTVSLLESGA